MPRTSQRKSQYEARDERYANENYPQSRSARNRARDEEGRFMSEEDESEGYGRSRQSSGSRRYASSSRGQGGWFGDPEGHSRAARRGWGEEEDYGYAQAPGGRRGAYTSSSRGRRQTQRGWFGDPEGHSEAARRGWENPDHGPSGWFGDPERHREAAREGWENPDHGPSGWFGDPEGHREAAERGWEQGHRGQRAGRRRMGNR